MSEALNRHMATLLAEGQAFAYCVVTSTRGSTPRKRGTAMLLLPDGRTFGTVGGGSIEKEVLDCALEALREGSPRLCSPGEAATEGCGGKMEVFIQVFGTEPVLHIFGAGHVGLALARIAPSLGFRVVLLHNKPDDVKASIPSGVRLVNGDPETLLKACSFGPGSFFVIATSEHKADIEYLAALAGKPLVYLGMLGSRNKVKEAREQLLLLGISEDVIDRIDMPVGLPIGAQGPEEIAVSIAARLIAVRRGAML
ncbi:MAG TPA: XdhC family protein [Bacteroidales bacterium]|nr:XdhC family protein [Bacteroidales bacterium]HRZ76570.1 XdhC family protein [Bacteroidales bacterium]